MLLFKRLNDVYEEETEKAIEENGPEADSWEETHSFILPKDSHWDDVRKVTQNVGEVIQEAAQAEREDVPEGEGDKGKAASTEILNGVKSVNTSLIVERVVTDTDDIVKIVRFDSWQNTAAVRREVKKTLRSVVWVKCKIKDKEVFNKAYSYIE